ncbi:MAG: SRPBCC domain-containing protein [Candidatus Thorarchaeota archaeon]|jgi:activator of HSP90 ATPase
MIGMTEKLKLSIVLPTTPAEIYKTWMSTKGHSAMTGADAKVSPKIGGKFTAWDEYIEGTTEELEKNQRILQKWRTTDFPDDSPDSLVEIILESVEKGTKITLIHTDIPKGQKESYKTGWKDFYFTPMKEFFGSS